MRQEQPEHSTREAETQSTAASADTPAEKLTTEPPDIGQSAETLDQPTPSSSRDVSSPGTPAGSGSVSETPFQRPVGSDSPAANESTPIPASSGRSTFGASQAPVSPRPIWTSPYERTGDEPAQPAAKSAPKREEPAGLLDLADDEVLVQDVDSGAEGRFILTNRRIIYQGHSSESAIFASAAVKDVTLIEFGRKERDSRSAWWGAIGILAAIAVWQVTTNQAVGAVAGLVVGGLSALLLADYWFRPHGLILRFGTAGGRIEGPVSGKRMREAEQLAARAQILARSKPSVSLTGQRPVGGNHGS